MRTPRHTRPNTLTSILQEVILMMVEDGRSPDCIMRTLMRYMDYKMSFRRGRYNLPEGVGRDNQGGGNKVSTEIITSRLTRENLPFRGPS